MTISVLSVLALAVFAMTSPSSATPAPAPYWGVPVSGAAAVIGVPVCAVSGCITEHHAHETAPAPAPAVNSPAPAQAPAPVKETHWGQVKKQLP